MKRRKKKRIWSLLICMVMLLSVSPLQIRASTSPPTVKRTLTVGQTLTLTYNNKSVKWSTSNKKVCSLSATSGKKVKVKANIKGTANIKAKINNKVVAICKITVKTGSSSTNNNNSSNNNSNNNNNNNSNGYTENSIDEINNYFKSNSQYTKISDGNGSFEKLNGHAGIQQSSFMRSGELMAASSLNGKYQYFTYDNNSKKYTGIGWKNAITLSFNNTTFQTGETCGVLRVLNCSVIGASYSWSSSDSNVVGISVLSPDVSAVRINAKSQGSATITCKISFPNGESKTLTSTVNVSNLIGSKIPNGTVDMNAVMNKIANAYRNKKNVNWIPDVMNTQKAAEMGYTALGSYSSYEITYPLIEEETMENMYNPNKRFQYNPQEYLIAYGSEIESANYYYVEYQGHNENGVQLACVGVLSIP